VAEIDVNFGSFLLINSNTVQDKKNVEKNCVPGTLPPFLTIHIH